MAPPKMVMKMKRGPSPQQMRDSRNTGGSILHGIGRAIHAAENEVSGLLGHIPGGVSKGRGRTGFYGPNGRLHGRKPFKG